MSLNKRMIKNVIIAVLSLVLLGVGYFLAVRWQPESNTPGETHNQSISVCLVEEKNISKIVFKNGNKTFSISRAGDEENWNISEKPGIELVQSKLQSAVYSLASVSAIRKLGEKPESLVEFGLDNEDKSVTIYTGDEEVTLILGDKVAVDSSYYLMKKGSGTVYTVSEYVADSILSTPNTFRKTTLAEISPSDITGLLIKHGGKKFMELAEAEKGQDNGLQTAILSMTYPYTEKVRTEPLGELLSAFTEVKVLGFVSDNMSDSTKYGIDKGWSVELKTKEQTHSISFGNSDENGNVYATYNDCGFIFAMSPNMQNAFKDIKPFDLVDKFAHLYVIDEVKSIDIELDGITRTMTIDDTGDNAKYKIDGKAASEDAFKGMYQIVVGRMFTDTVKNEALKGKEAAKITFNMADGKKNTARYYEYDDRSFMVEKPDGKKYLILKKYIDELKEKLEAFCNEPTVKP